MRRSRKHDAQEAALYVLGQHLLHHRLSKVMSSTSLAAPSRRLFDVIVRWILRGNSDERISAVKSASDLGSLSAVLVLVEDPWANLRP